MSWEETVMSDKEFLELSSVDRKKISPEIEIHTVDELILKYEAINREIAKAQAEKTGDIAYKKGMEAGNQKAYEIGVEDGKVEGIAEGMKEVAEFVENNYTYNGFLDTITIDNKAFETFLKEKGL